MDVQMTRKQDASNVCCV